MNNSFEEIIEVIENSNKIAVAGHISPDGDAVASCCSMAMALIKKGKNAVDCCCIKEHWQAELFRIGDDPFFIPVN